MKQTKKQILKKIELELSEINFKLNNKQKPEPLVYEDIFSLKRHQPMFGFENSMKNLEKTISDLFYPKKSEAKKTVEDEVKHPLPNIVLDCSGMDCIKKEPKESVSDRLKKQKAVSELEKERFINDIAINFSDGSSKRINSNTLMSEYFGTKYVSTEDPGILKKADNGKKLTVILIGEDSVRNNIVSQLGPIISKLIDG